LDQMVEVRRAPRVGKKSAGALAAGSVFHTLCEVHYTPDVLKDQPLRGTDGNPVLRTTADVVAWYLERAEAKAIDEAVRGFEAYLEHHLRALHGGAFRVLGSPEVDVSSTVSYGGQTARYQSQADLVIVTDDGVAAVEHKFLSSASKFVLERYAMSGQMSGHALAWNSDPARVAKHGRMNAVLLNLGFKSGKPRAHREWVAVTVPRQRQYAQIVVAAGRKVDTLLEAHAKARPGAARAANWPKLGSLYGLCDGVGGRCEYRHLCHDGADVVKPLYQITEAGQKQAEADGVVKVDPLTPTWHLDEPMPLPVEKAVEVVDRGSWTDPAMDAFLNQPLED